MKFEEIEIGATASTVREVTAAMVEAFAEVSGDKNPIHLDEDYAKNTLFGKRIAHGILSASFISSVIANQLPGEGSIYLSQSLKFLAPVYLGDTITTTVTVTGIKPEKKIVFLKTECHNGNNKIVISGEAVIKHTD